MDGAVRAEEARRGKVGERTSQRKEDLLRFYEGRVSVEWYSCGIRRQGRRLSARLTGEALPSPLLPSLPLLLPIRSEIPSRPLIHRG